MEGPHNCGFIWLQSKDGYVVFLVRFVSVILCEYLFRWEVIVVCGVWRLGPTILLIFPFMHWPTITVTVGISYTNISISGNHHIIKQTHVYILPRVSVHHFLPYRCNCDPPPHRFSKMEAKCLGKYENCQTLFLGHNKINEK